MISVIVPIYNVELYLPRYDTFYRTVKAEV